MTDTHPPPTADGAGRLSADVPLSLIRRHADADAPIPASWVRSLLTALATAERERDDAWAWASERDVEIRRAREAGASLAASESRTRALREALEFYEEPTNYACAFDDCHAGRRECTTAVGCDRGEIAQQALAADSGGSGSADDPAGRWNRSVAAIRACPELRESILRSVMSSMQVSGFAVDRARSEALFEQALIGPPLIYPGEQFQDGPGAAPSGEA